MWIFDTKIRSGNPHKAPETMATECGQAAFRTLPVKAENAGKMLKKKIETLIKQTQSASRECALFQAIFSHEQKHALYFNLNALICRRLRPFHCAQPQQHDIEPLSHNAVCNEILCRNETFEIDDIHKVVTLGCLPGINR